jgi:hypothetical protein
MTEPRTTPTQSPGANDGRDPHASGAAGSPTNQPPRRRTRRRTPRRRKLLRLLAEGDMTAAEIFSRLRLTPREAREMVTSDIFARELDALIAISAQQHRLTAQRSMTTALQSLTELARGEGETARKACLDLMNLAEQAPAPELGAGAAGELERRIEQLLEQLGDPPAEGGAHE